MKYFFTLVFTFAYAILSAQQMADFLTIEAQIEPIAEEGKVEGRFKVQFISLKDQDSLFLDAKAMKIVDVAHEGVAVSSDESHIWLHGPFQEGRRYTAFFTYEAYPKQALYFTHDQIWTQGQGKYTSHWLPSLDVMTDKIEFDLHLVASPEKTVIANGALVEKVDYDSKRIWKFDMEHPMSSYLVAFAIGDFQSVTSEGHSVPLEYFYRPQDSLYVEPTYRYTDKILDFFEEEIGVSFPWNSYKQVPIKGFLYAGMENTTATFFSLAFVVDSIGFIDRNYVNVNAHEMAHQWFGDMVTETESLHHWLHEGFATYYALLAERYLFGEEYFYWKLYNTAEQLQSQSDQGKGEALLNPKASSLTYYEKGAWALHILSETVGEEAFKRGIKSYLERYAFQNVTTEDFLQEMEKASGLDLGNWKRDWLEQSAFKAEQAYESLLKSPFMNRYFEVAALKEIPLEEKRERLIEAITSNDDFIGQEAVYQLADEPFEKTELLYLLALQQENVFVRQAVALSMDRIPKSFQKVYEGLLKDPSYVTQEAALYNLWVNFPEKRRDYLDQMGETLGFQDRNIRQLRLALSLYTNTYLTPEKAKFSEELQGYTAPEYSFEVREKAFEFLHSMELTTDTFLKNLVNACTHHYWRFRDGARAMLAEYMKLDSQRNRILGMMDGFSEKEKAYLKRVYKLE